MSTLGIKLGDGKLVLILFIALILRFWLMPKAFHVDILSQAGWGQFVAETGSKDFYTNTVWVFSWPNHPPLTSLYYGYCFKMYREISLRFHQSVLLLNKFDWKLNSYRNFVNSLDSIVSPSIPFPLGYLLSLKILPVLSDILIGILIYIYSTRLNTNKYLYTSLYLFMPFSWYISALWGQTDQLTFLLIILSFIVISKYPIWSIILFYLGVSMKPTGIVLIPLYLLSYFHHHNFFNKKFWLGVVLVLIANTLLFSLFTRGNIVNFTFETLLPRLMDRPPRLTTNAYNFWHMFDLNKGLPDKYEFLYLPATIWAGVSYLIINYLSFKLIKSKKYISMGTLFVVGLGSWMFLTDMLDRYSFVGIVSGLFVCLAYPKLLKFWIILALVYCLNVYKGWYYPETLWFLKSILTKDNYTGILLAGINTLVYLIMTKKIFYETFVKTK